MKFKKLIAIILCFVLCTLLCPAVSAATGPKIIVSNEAAFPGEEVSVSVSISNNPGIMSMAFSITYNQEYFEFTSCTKGFISTPTFKDHSDKGYIAITVSESSDVTNVGNMLNLTFRVKGSAPVGTYPITLANINPVENGNDLSNAFANSKEDTFNPVVQAGGIRVKGQCDISGHIFGEWTETKPANCTELGKKERTCSVCNEIEEGKIPFVHDFEDVWTIDKPATPDEKGIMSRHCTLCDAVTDELTFSYDEITDDDENPDDTNSDNTSSDDTSSDDTSSDSTTSGNTSSDGTTSNDTSSGTGSQKPNIDNVEGEKVPESEAGKLEDFDNIKPDEEPEVTPDDTVSKEEDTTSSTPADTTSKPAATTNSDDTEQEEKPFFSTTMGIITIIICVLLSFGIIALAILLIAKNKKSE